MRFSPAQGLVHLGKLEGVAWLQATVSPPHQPPRSALPRTAWTLPRSGSPTRLPPRIHALAGPDMRVGRRSSKCLLVRETHCDFCRSNRQGKSSPRCMEV